MKIERVKLRGFVGIRKGLGLDAIELDLSPLSGLIALAGPNGKGKSTLLENLSPFRTLASRKGSLQHHTFLRDSEKRLSFRWNGDLYETQVKIDSQSGRGEAFIYKNGQPEIKGKSSEYDRYMVELLGSPELFFASVFSCQGGTKLSDMTTGQLKSLFSEFLRLHFYEEREETSKQARNILNGKAEALENERQYLEAETKKKADLGRKWEDLKGSIELKADFYAHDKAKIILLEDSLKALRSRVESNRIHETRLKDLQAQGAKLAADWKKEKETGEKAIADLRAKASQVSAEILATSKLIERKKEIEGAVETETMLNRTIQAISSEISMNEALLRDVLDEMNQAGQRKVKLEAQIESLKHDEQLRNLKNTIASLREKKIFLERRDTALQGAGEPPCASKACPFIVSALKSSELPTIEKALSDRLQLIAEKERALLDELATAKGILQAKSNLRSNLHANIKSLSSKVESDKASLQKAHSLSSLKSQLDTATAKLEGLSKRKEELLEEMNTRRKALEERAEQAWICINANAKDIQEAQSQVDPLAAEDLEAEEKNLRDLQASKEKTEAEITTLKGELASLEAQVRAIEEKERRLSEIREKRQIILSEASQWEYLKNACSKDGLRALEIDSVAPSISFHANDLLSRTFGPLFQCRLRTQDDEGRETLQIMVIREDGSETLLDNLSGGEKVWILKALRLSMMMISKEKSGRSYGSFFCDEEDGPLSSDNAVHFINLYRSCMAAAKMETCFYISHRPEAIAMADHLLEFTGKGIEIQ